MAPRGAIAYRFKLYKHSCEDEGATSSIFPDWHQPGYRWERKADHNFDMLLLLGNTKYIFASNMTLKVFDDEIVKSMERRRGIEHMYQSMSSFYFHVRSIE